MNGIWYFNECLNCGHIKRAIGARYDAEHGVTIDPFYENMQDTYKKNHYCEICGSDLRISKFEYLGEYHLDEKIRDLRKRRKETLAYQKTLFEKYAANDEEIARKYRLREEIETEKYREEMREKTFPIRVVLIVLLIMFLTAPIADGIAFIGIVIYVFVALVKAAANSKGSTIIFWDDYNHRHK